MTVFPIEHANQVAEISASRELMEASANAARLARWKTRYPYTPVDVPTPKTPPSWPAFRASLELPATVTRLPAKAGAK